MSNILTPRRAVSAMFILNGGLLGVWASRIPAIAGLHALTPNLLGLLLLCLAAGAITAFPLAGRLADSFGAARVTRGIAVCYAIALILIALAPGIFSLALCLFLFGMAHGAMDVTMNVWAAEVERAARRPVMSTFHAMFSLGAGLGAGLGFFAIRAELSLTAHLASASIALAIPCLAFASAPWPSPRLAPGKATLFAWPKGALALVGLITFAAAMGEGAVADWAGIFLKDSIGTTEARATLGYSVFSIAIFAARLAGDSVIARFGPVRVARASGLAAFAGVLIATSSHSLGQTLAGFALMGTGYAVLFPLAFSRAAADHNISPGRAIASVATLGYGGLLLGPPVIGFLAQASSLRLALLILAALALAVTALAPSLAPPAKPAPKP